VEDEAAARFEGGDNSFVADLELLRGGAIIIEDESGSVLGKLPPLEQILAFAAPAGIASVAGTQSQQALVALAQDAVLDKNWHEAARRWDACITCFGAKPHWLSNRAHALFEAGRLAEAEREYLSMAQTFPHLSTGMVGLARLAQRRSDWPAAVANWTYCLENFGGAYSTHWVVAKAHALRELGRLSEAERLVREFSDKRPDNGTLSAERMKLTLEHARRTGQLNARREELCEEIGARFPEGSGTDALIESMRLFTKLGEYDKARQRLMVAAPMVSAPGEIEILFRAASELVEPGSRGPVWEQLLAAARGRSVELELRLLLALERFAPFARTFDAARESLRGNANLELLTRFRARLGKPRSEVFAEHKVFGIGLSRTGTRSLARALQVLGFQAAHWTNPLTFQIIGPTDIYLFDAALDIAVAQDFEKLYYQYPNARFVWTHRPLEGWLTSVERHYQYWHRANGIAGLRQELENGVVAFGLSRAPIEFGLYLNAGDFGAAYETFERRVRSFFRDKPPEKLLVLDIFAGEGWNELCRFLDASVPIVPFPYCNKGLPVLT
jgi:tetratricopeptide (TPR) repeat protein